MDWTKPPRHLTGQQLIDALEPHYTDRTGVWYHYEQGQRVDVERRICTCQGWQSHPDIERIDPEATYRWATGGTCGSWQKIDTSA
jgi:hypothetical protein